MTLDVIVVTFNSAATVLDCVRSALACPQVSSVVIVDNSSTDDTVRRCREVCVEVIECSSNRGFAARVNTGLRALPTASSLVLLLNPDATITEECLQLLVDALCERDEAVFAGPVLIGPDGGLCLGARRFSTLPNRTLSIAPIAHRVAHWSPEYADPVALAGSGDTLTVDYLWGAVLLARRSFLDQIGGLDERFFMYSEDEDLGRQARLHGCLSLLVTRARATHIGGAGSPTCQAVVEARKIAANQLLLRKWDPPWVAVAYWAGARLALATQWLAWTVRRKRGDARLAARTLVLLHTGGPVRLDESGRSRLPAIEAVGDSALHQAGSPTTASSGDAMGLLNQACGYACAALHLIVHGVLKRTVFRTGRSLGDQDRRSLESTRTSAGSGIGPDAGVQRSRFQTDVPRAGEAGVAGPLISVVLPVFNASSRNLGYLNAALESVHAQKHHDMLELVIVDDGSTDDTVGHVESFLGDHPDLSARVVRKQNGGQSSARNFGVRESRGAWLGFLDQDDTWTPDHLERIVPYLTDGIDMVYTDADTIDEAGKLKEAGIHRNRGLGGGHPKSSLEDVLFQDVFVMPGVVTIRRQLFDAVGGFDEQLSGYEDDDLFVRCFQRGRLHYLPVSTLGWRIHRKSASHTERMVISGLRYWRKLLQTQAGDQADDIVRRVTLRFVRVFLSYAWSQFLEDNVLFEKNLAAAESLVRHLSVVDRTAFKLTRWAWRRPGIAAHCARAWFMRGLQIPVAPARQRV